MPGTDIIPGTMAAPTIRCGQIRGATKNYHSALLLCIFAALSPVGSPSDAHEKKGKTTVAKAIDTEALEITITVAQGSPAPVVQVLRGTVVHISVHGAGEHDLHLHGYDISADRGSGDSAVFVFEARHTGRFAIVAHDVEDLLRRRETPVAYVEVRAP